MNHKINIRAGSVADSARANQLYTLAKDSLKAAGIDQWQGIYPNGDDFIQDVHDNRAIVMEQDGSTVGIAAVYIGHEPTYDKISDGQWLTNHQTYGIIHRIAVDPCARNAGIASAVMAYLQGLCLQAGICSMRCDTHRDNKAMQHTLEKNGYQKCGIIIVEDGTERLAYEKLL